MYALRIHVQLQSIPAVALILNASDCLYSRLSSSLSDAAQLQGEPVVFHLPLLTGVSVRLELHLQRMVSVNGSEAEL